jgi:hypothetical protein
MSTSTQTNKQKHYNNIMINGSKVSSSMPILMENPPTRWAPGQIGGPLHHSKDAEGITAGILWELVTEVGIQNGRWDIAVTKRRCRDSAGVNGSRINRVTSFCFTIIHKSWTCALGLGK